MGSARISCNMLPNGRAVVSRVLKASVPVRGLARGYKWADMGTSMPSRVVRCQCTANTVALVVCGTGRNLACGFVPCHRTLGALSDFRHFSVLLTPKYVVTLCAGLCTDLVKPATMRGVGAAQPLCSVVRQRFHVFPSRPLQVYHRVYVSKFHR
jgi:hypothetical protein